MQTAASVASLATMAVRPLRAEQLRPDLSQALANSGLVYLTPIRSDGSFSRCQAELWFVRDGSDIVVVSKARSWRVQAVRKGLTSARLWLGDLGVWTRTDGAYLKLPSIKAYASIVDDPSVHAALLRAYGKKYRLGWMFWKNRFTKGLRAGTRVMLRYRPA